ncbi:MAG: hypothetical protein MRJ93_04915 [Nitrososphaeraceae archaeon]|nr:hypothetical protein [Nitrososphaeraceae archaeon]
MNEDPATNQQECDTILGAGSTDLEGVVTTGDFGPTQYDMTLTNDNTPPDVFDIDNTQFVLDVDEGVTTAFVTPGFTYTLAETQIETAAGPVPVTTNVPIGCENIATAESEPGALLTATGSAVIAGGQAVVCAIQNSECVDGLLIETNTVDAECEVANVVISAAAAGGIPIGIGKGVECALNEDPATNQQECDTILGAGSTDLEGVVTTGDFGPTQYDMTLTNDNTPPDVFDIDNTQFVLDVDEGVTTAFVTPGFTYTLAETQIETAAGPVPVTTNVPIGCENIATAESEPGALLTATGSAVIAGGQAVVCAIQNSECVDGLLIETNTVDAECEVANVVIPVVPNGDTGTGTLSITKNVECQVQPGVNPTRCNPINNNVGPDDFTIDVTGGNPVPSSFLGSTDPQEVELGAGNYEVSETPNEVVEGILANPPTGTNRDLIAAFNGECTQNGDFSAAGSIEDGQSQTCNIVNTFEISAAAQ